MHSLLLSSVVDPEQIHFLVWSEFDSESDLPALKHSKMVEFDGFMHSVRN